MLIQKNKEETARGLLSCLTQLTAFLANRRHFCLFLLELKKLLTKHSQWRKGKLCVSSNVEKHYAQSQQEKTNKRKNATAAYITRAEKDHKERSAT